MRHLPVVAVNLALVLVVSWITWRFAQAPPNASTPEPAPVAELERQGFSVSHEAGGTVMAARPNGLFVRDPHVGWRLAPNLRVQQRRYLGPTMLYDAVYQTDAYGARSALGPLSQDEESVLLLGCSFMFGQGLDDAATIASQLRQLSSGRLDGINLGVPAYGPHQSLAMLQADYESAAVTKRRLRGAVYLAAPFQVERSAGHWVMTGGDPRFVLDGTTLRREGTFDKPTALWNGLVERFRRVSPWADDERLGDEALYVALLREMATLLRQRYGVELHVIVWPDAPRSELHRLSGALTDAGLPVTRLDARQGGFDRTRYTIADDGHPSAEGARLVAQAIWESRAWQARR